MKYSSKNVAKRCIYCFNYLVCGVWEAWESF